MYQGTYRAAVIGHTGRGDYGHGLDLSFWGLPRIELVALADPDEAGRALAIGRTGARRGYDDYHRLLERERPDVVAVCTRWPDQHEAMITAAARGGARAVFCEKPLASSPAAADRLLAACAAHGVGLAVAHHNRVRPAPALARRLIGEGRIGRLRLMRAYGKCDHRSGGEDLLVLGTHLMDLMRRFAGDARWCDARVTTGGRDAERGDVTRSRTEDLGPVLGDDVWAVYGFDNGVTGTFESAPAAAGGGGEYFRLELCGTAGILALWSDPGSRVGFLPRPFALPGRDGEWQFLDPPPMASIAAAPAAGGVFFDSNQALVVDLLEAAEQHRPPVSDGHGAAAALEMLLGVYASHLRGERVPLPLGDRSHPLELWLEQR